MLEELDWQALLLWTVPADNQYPQSIKSDLAETKGKTFSPQIFKHLKFSYRVQYKKEIQKEMYKPSLYKVFIFFLTLPENFEIT